MNGPAPVIEYVIEGFYLEPGGQRVWKEWRHYDAPPADFDVLAGADTTGKVGQPSEWRLVERDLCQLYAVQGHYPAPSGRSWQNHTARVDLETARMVYRWFHRLCQDDMDDGPNEARVINMGTREVMPMEGFAPLSRQPGDAMRTFPVTPAEWQATLRMQDPYRPIRRALRKDGTFVLKIGRDYIVGYEDAAGNVRIRPREFAVPDRRDEAEAARLSAPAVAA